MEQASKKPRKSGMKSIKQGIERGEATMPSPVIRETEAKSILTKSNLPVSDYSVNPYIGCTHACKYCYASFMNRSMSHPEPWGEYLDVKRWKPIGDLQKVCEKRAVYRLGIPMLLGSKPIGAQKTGSC